MCRVRHQPHLHTGLTTTLGRRAQSTLWTVTTPKRYVIWFEYINAASHTPWDGEKRIYEYDISLSLFSGQFTDGRTWCVRAFLARTPHNVYKSWDSNHYFGWQIRWNLLFQAHRLYACIYIHSISVRLCVLPAAVRSRDGTFRDGEMDCRIIIIRLQCVCVCVCVDRRKKASEME